MTNLLVRPSAPDAKRRILHITPASAGWQRIGFDVYKLGPGESASAETGDSEDCLVFIGGRGRVTAGGQDLGLLGERKDPFSGRPHSVYVPAGSAWTVTAEGSLELAVCSAPGVRNSRPPRVIGPDSHPYMTRGKGSNIRYVSDIISEHDPADGLLVVEVTTPAGNSSSYPPHKHDRDAFPDETQLEEVYYHRLNPSQGFAFQRVYTDDLSLDVTMTLQNGDASLVPRGYHPCVAPHGYDLYYLNVMAGPKRVWRIHNDPAHEWMLKA